MTITLPSNQTTPGVVSKVGTVATTPSSGGSNGGGSASGSSGGSSSSGGTPTIEVDITPSDPAATGALDQAPVTVTITTATVNDGLVVPVDALLALSAGRFAVEVVGVAGVHHLVPVTLGLFDDADGLVQVTASGLSAGDTCGGAEAMTSVNETAAFASEHGPPGARPLPTAGAFPRCFSSTR